MPIPWFFPPEASQLYKEKLKSDVKYYIWDDPYLWRLCNDQVIHKCISDIEINSVLQFCHAAFGGGHYGSTRTAQKVLDYGFYWPTIFRRHLLICLHLRKMPEIFDIWGIDFMGKFLVSNGYSYILLAVDYVSRWVEAISTKTNDAKIVVDFLKSNIFCWFGVPKALISDQEPCLPYSISMGVLHRVATSYHPKTNGQAEVFNREIKKTLQKMVNPSWKD
ncbi:gag-pol, partial [Mucuna pruriens]